MKNNDAEKTERSILDRYHQKAQGSLLRHLKAKNNFPGGDTRSATYFNPFPLYMEKGKGSRLTDCDGNVYLDLLNNYSSLIHGHAQGDVLLQAQQQLKRGSVFGAPSEERIWHASHLRQRIPSLEWLRYCNSGTEATMFALRTARAFTGRDKIIKVDGGYHGTHDFVEVSVHAAFEKAEVTASRLNSRGVPACVLQNVLVAPFNNLAAMASVMAENEGQIAAIIVEPMLGAGGVVPAADNYLRGLRELADKYGALLIFDEVITFRLSSGGMQETENVKPDLTALGKIIGGGFAVGAFGGRREIMEVFNPENSDSISHSGTFNGNHVTMGAGLVTLELYDSAAVTRLNKMGERMRNGFSGAFTSNGIKAQVTGIGSVIGVHWSDEIIVNGGDVVRGAKKSGNLSQLLHLELLNQGIFSSSRGMYILSTPMAEEDVDSAVDTFERTLKLLIPCVAEKAPHLL
ncbi:MAG: aspartate aminotransferase family protein [SAR324 cluster bacterium]|jgi:glutamate-1-semialdehyde 2,1-aminomutase|nr:aspartate aminotransferase family protein [SAR324 cluster bacterium]